ncbi:MAG TPA: hypothetical protein VHZ24_01260 [Pirellulales bacterium]|jgi:hypothetical protein|nr:hypothetical protein [Pirellulales bacterium]
MLHRYASWLLAASFVAASVAGARAAGGDANADDANAIDADGVALPATGEPLVKSRLRIVDFSDFFPAEGLPWHANHAMRLRSDGNLPGQLRAFDASGGMVPVRGRLYFVQNGEIVGKGVAEENGYFQAVGLHEGVYSVIASGRDGFGAFSVRVVPEKPAAALPPKVKSISQPLAAAALPLDSKLPAGKLPAKERLPLERVALPVEDDPHFEGLILSATAVASEDLIRVGQIMAYHIPQFRAYAKAGAGADRNPAPAEPQGAAPGGQQGAPPAPREARGRIGALGALLPGDAPASAIVSVGFPRNGLQIRRDRREIFDERAAKRKFDVLPASVMPEDGPWFGEHTVHLQDDGRIVGQLREFDGDGKLIPISVWLHFVRAGELVGITSSDEEGNFELAGLRTGNYSVLAAGGMGLGAFAIRVLPIDLTAPSLPADGENPEGEKKRSPPPKEADDDDKIPAKRAAMTNIMQGGSMLISITPSDSFAAIGQAAVESGSPLTEGFATPSLATAPGAALGGAALPGSGIAAPPAAAGAAADAGVGGLAGAGGGAGASGAGAAAGGAGGGLGGLVAGAGLGGAAAAIAGQNTNTSSSPISTSSSD